MIRQYRVSDAEQVLTLNESCVPEVGPMDRTKLASFEEWAPYLKVVDVDGEIVGLLIGLDQSAPYGSPNFGWFTERVDRFAYIDRIAVAESQRGNGWGPALYQDFEAWARKRNLPALTAEVNVEPPNPRSMRFHELFGFTEMDEFEPTGSADYRVAMLRKPLADDS